MAETSLINNIHNEPKLKKQKSGVQLIKQYFLRKTQNIYKLNLSDEEAFKWKFNMNKNSRPLSSFKLLNKESTNGEITQRQLANYEDLKNYNFPVLQHKNKDLAEYAILIMKNNQYFRSTVKSQEFLRKLITEISLTYNIVSYHNFSHAFSLSLMLNQCFQYHLDLGTKYTEEDKYYAILAGLAHDLNHPGTNNAFEIKKKSKLAVQFNNESVLENFHIREFWKLLQKNQQINFLKKIPNPQDIKKKITSLILMTDVGQHFKNVQKFKSLKSEATINNENFLDKAQNKEFFLGQLFHACDIGNPCIDFENYITWAALLSHEFNEQTVLEKQNEVEITEMLRYKDLTTFYKGQIGFINYLVMPLWKQIVQICQNLRIFTDNVNENIKILNYKIEHARQQDEHDEIRLL